MADEKENPKEGNKKFGHGLLAFLREYSVIGLAIGVIVAQSSKSLIDAMVSGLFTPFIGLFVPGKTFEQLKWTVGDSVFDIGSVISSFLSFVIVMTILYVVIKKILKREDLIKKK